MGKKVALALFLVGFVPVVSSAHEFYLSITTIQHVAEEEKLSIRIKIFVNDLEESIFQEQGVRLGLWKNTPIDNAQSYVEDYICSRLSISINNTPIPLEFNSLKVESAEILEDHVILCQLEAYNVSEIISIKIQNSFLIESFDSQANIVNINANNTRKTINLDKRLSEDQIIYTE
ncbi:MAG: DUF6702 family protein [Bacteroidota bacterium]